MMKRKLREINAGTGTTFQNKCIFSPTDVVDLLEQIEELRKCNVGLKPDAEGNLILIVGNNEYMMTDKTQMVFV